MKKHDPEQVAATPKHTDYKCRTCCRPFRVLAGTTPVWPEDCEGKRYVATAPASLPPTPDVPSPSTFPPDGSQWLANGGPVATQEEQKRRLLICHKCGRIEECAPTQCAKRKLWETGRCNEWTIPTAGLPPTEAEQYQAFLAKWPGFGRVTQRMAVSHGPPHHRAIRLYAFLSTWHEADIVEAAVRNCFAEGCDRVYLLDNDSPDGSAALGVKAGALLAKSYHTEYFQDVLRVTLLNDIMRDITEAEAHPELWWICLDCDEFPRGPGGFTVRQYVQQLPEECNAVGADAFDHYPTDAIANIPGKHPAHCQPFGWLRRWPNKGFCAQGHWKHPLQRYRNGVYSAIYTRGLHEAHITEQHGKPREPAVPILNHHFMYRNEVDTRLRLTRLCGPDPALNGNNRSLPDDKWIEGEGAMTRFRNLDLIYAQDWKNARMPHMQATPELKAGGVPARHWCTWFQASDYLPRIP